MAIMAPSTMAIMAPSGSPLKTAGLQGKSRRVGSTPLGGSHGLVWLFLAKAIHALRGQPWTRLAFSSKGEKYWPNGGIAFAHKHGGGLAPWSKKAIVVSSCGPGNPVCGCGSVTFKEAPNEKGPVLQRGQPASFGRRFVWSRPVAHLPGGRAEYSSSHLATAKLRRKARVSLRPT